MQRFARIVNGLQLLTIFAKCSILDFLQGSEYSPEVALQMLMKLNNDQAID